MTDWPALKNPVPSRLKKYVDETLRNLKPIPEGELFPTWTTSAGWFCAQLPWLLVEGYDLADACKGQADEDIRRELCCDWYASTGKRVLPEFAPYLHVAAQELEFYPELPLVLGWDMPGTPACVVTQLNPFGQWCLLSSVAPKEEESIGVYDFGQRVHDHLLHGYALPNGLALSQIRIQHYGDPAGHKAIPRPGQAPQEARACFDIIKNGVKVVVGHDENGKPEYEERPGFGWDILPGDVGIKARLEALRARLRTTVAEGLPAFVICPTAKALLDAFSGYHHKQKSDGSYEDDPAKTWESHQVDAAAYACTRLFERPKKKDEHGRKNTGWRSQASSDRRR